jgi:hypothetical protein
MVRAELFQIFNDLLRPLPVNPRKNLIEKQNRRIPQKRPGQGDG